MEPESTLDIFVDHMRTAAALYRYGQRDVGYARELIEAAAEGRRDLFDGLAACIGIRAPELDAAWAFVRAHTEGARV